MYHRVASVATDPWGLAVTPANFAAQMALIQRRRVVLPIGEFVAQARLGRLPRHAVALTFDDGYLDNLTEAAPILAAAKLPATLFLATGPSEHGRFYWWDELAAMILDAPPTQYAVTIGGERHAIDLEAREPADETRDGWRAWDPRTVRECLYYQLWKAMGALEWTASLTAMASLRRIFPSRPDPSVRPMTLQEVATLTKRAPFTLGGHTADHVDLPAQMPREALDQILRGNEAIRAITGCDPVGFAYPSGRRDRTTRLLVEAAGLPWACTTEHGCIPRRPDHYELPRIAAPDVPDIDWLA
jgi:peptidoglycan/xylan/chitin deacetylase (PgdA/CDA1 family)